MREEKINLPNHVGIILDGNRRWAEERGLSVLDGHRKGAETLKDISLAAFDKGVKYLSAFIFSSENWQRKEEEVSHLMWLLVKAVEKYLDEFHLRGIRIVLIGQRHNLARNVLQSIEKTEEKTRANTEGTLALCFNYGGQQEIIDAVKKIAQSDIATQDLTKDVFEQYLYTPEIPQVDLIIRTSGEERTSGFMLWRAAYAELLFMKKYWPDFRVEDLDMALLEYSTRQRRFGT